MESLLNIFAIVSTTIFVAELTDKDALLLLTLATRTRALFVFAAGSIAFAITTTIIVLVGAILVSYIPIFWVKISGGAVMLAYSFWQFVKGSKVEEDLEGKERLLLRTARVPIALLWMISSLIVLDLAGDATEVLTIVFIAQYNSIIVIFAATLFSLVLATALETVVGNRLGRILSAARLWYFSVVVFAVIGIVVVTSSVFPLPYL